MAYPHTKFVSLIKLICIKLMEMRYYDFLPSFKKISFPADNVLQSHWPDTVTGFTCGIIHMKYKADWMHTSHRDCLPYTANTVMRWACREEEVIESCRHQMTFDRKTDMEYRMSWPVACYTQINRTFCDNFPLGKRTNIPLAFFVFHIYICQKS